jgi:hypothetical protein
LGLWQLQTEEVSEVTMPIRILSSILLLSVLLNSVGCSVKRGPSQDQKISTINVQLNKDDLEGIRGAAIAHYESGKHENRDAFVAELKRGPFSWMIPWVLPLECGK